LATNCRMQRKEIFSLFLSDDKELYDRFWRALNEIKKDKKKLLTASYVIELLHQLDKIKAQKPALASIIRAYQSGLILELERIARGQVKKEDIIASSVIVGAKLLFKKVFGR